MKTNITLGNIASGSEVVDLALAKQNSNIEHSYTEEYLQLLLDAAVEEAENYTGNALLQRNVAIGFSCWATKLDVPYGPLSSIVSMTYVDANGDVQTVPSSDYALYGLFGGNEQKVLVKLNSFPELHADTDFPITINAVAGYENSKMPKAAQSAVLLRFSHKEMFREDSPIPIGKDRSFKAALRPFKRW